jgi:hypothetical protein
MSRRQDRSGEKDLIVSNLSQAITLLRQCSNAEDAKKLVDVGMAAKVYAQRRRLGIEAQDSATAFVLRAVRRLGEILTDTDRHQGGRPNGKPVEPEQQVPKLRELGISRDLSSKAQRIATIPEKNFEFTLAHTMSRGNISVKEIQRRMLESADRFNDKPETPDDGPKINYSCPACGHGWHGKPKASGDGKPWFPCEAVERICNVIDRELERADEGQSSEVVSELREKVFHLIGVERWRCGWKGCEESWEGTPIDGPQDWAWPDRHEIAALVNGGLAAEHVFGSFVVLCPEHQIEFSERLWGQKSEVTTKG